MRRKKADSAQDNAWKAPEEKLNELIRQKAQELYEKKGRVSGHDMENWLEAEKLVKSGRP